MRQKRPRTSPPYPSQISLEELYEKLENEEPAHPIKIPGKKKGRKNEVFEILNVLGKGRSTFTFLSMYGKKFAALRMSYDEEDFTGKFDSIIEQGGDDYKRYFLDVLYASMPVQRLYYGKLKKNREILFDKTVYVSFWEKADALLEDKLGESTGKKFKWFREFLKGLSIIHSKDRAHFDIKPANLFLVNNRVKIGDFEFYWKIKDFIDTKKYLYCGTIGYIAPEMFYDRDNITAKVDIFSAGVAFARLFTAETYRHIELNREENRQLGEILQKCERVGRFDNFHTAEIKESLRYSFFYRQLVRDKIERERLNAFERFLYEEILLKMMSPDPANRMDIDEIIDKPGIKGPAIGEKAAGVNAEPLKSRDFPGWWWFIVGFLVTAAVGLFLYFFVYSGGKSPEPPHPTPTVDVKPIIKPPAKTGSKPPPPPGTRKARAAPEQVEPVETVKPSPGKAAGSGISPAEKEKLANRLRYEAYLDMAGELIKSKEYQRALEMIARAREIKETPGLLSLELEIKRRLKELKERELEYERGLAMVEENIAAENYLMARKLIDALKKIKIGAGLLELEKEVNRGEARVTWQRREEEERAYRECLQKIQVYMNNGDYEGAEQEINKAGKIKDNDLLKRLGEKLKQLREQRRRE